MANIIKPKRTNTAGNTPTTSNLASGELGVNMADQKTYINNGTAIVQIGAGKLTALGDVNVTSPTDAQTLVYDTASGKWVNSTPAGAGDVTGPSSATDNALARYDGTTGKLIQNSLVTVDDSGNVSGVLSEQFNLVTTPPAIVEGLEAWDSGNGTLEVGLKGGNISYKYGQQEFARVYNGSGSAMTKGQVVYIVGAQGNRVDVRLALGTSDSTSAGTIGFVAEAIANGAEGWVQVSGSLYKLDTTGLTAGAAVYLSTTTAGAYTTTKPTAPNHTVMLGWVQRVDNTVGSIYVKVDNGYELDELHNVQITSPVNDQSLVYDSATQVWKNNTVSLTNGVNGILPVASGGSGTNTPSLVAGTNVTITGCWPNQTIDASGGGGSSPATPTVLGTVYGQTTCLIGCCKTALGYQAGAVCQGSRAIAIGASAGNFLQGSNAIAIGYNAGGCFQPSNSIAIGANVNPTGSNQTHIGPIRNVCSTSGFNALFYNACTKEVVRGLGSATPTVLGTVYGQTTIACGVYKTSLGFNSGLTNQGNFGVAIGKDSGKCNQGGYSVAIGSGAGQTSQGCQSISIGQCAGGNTQGSTSIAIGLLAGQNCQGANAIAIGKFAGSCAQPAGSIALGNCVYPTGTCQTHIGPIRSVCACVSPYRYLYYNNCTKEVIQGTVGIAAQPTALGTVYGRTNGGGAGGNVALGYCSAVICQGTHAIAIGQCSGWFFQGTNAIAIGYNAGVYFQPSCSIAIGANVNPTGSNQTHIGPIRNVCSTTGLNSLYYNACTKEVVRSAGGSGPSPATPTALGTVYGLTQDCVSGGRTALGNKPCGCIGGYSVSIGYSNSASGGCAVSVGTVAAVGCGAVAVGFAAVATSGVAIGYGSLANNSNGVSIGRNIKNMGCGNSVIIGAYSCSFTNGSVVLGNCNTVCFANNVNIIGNGVYTSSSNRTYVTPIRNATTAYQLYYDPTTKEITYG